MALITNQFYSEVLEMAMTMNVILPEANRVPEDKQYRIANGEYPTLFLLHGLADDESAWGRYTSIERYANEEGLAVVMPNGDRSFYTDIENGHAYFKYISEEIPRIAQKFFPLSKKREDNFVAGLSMGGYGAFKIGLTYPDRFAAIASLSGVLDIDLRWQEQEAAGMGRPYQMAFGKTPVRGTENDIFYLFNDAIETKGPLPKLFQCCGTEDFLYEGNLNFRKLALKHPKLDYTYQEGPGAHTWDYWDCQIQKVLKWLPIR